MNSEFDGVALRAAEGTTGVPVLAIGVREAVTILKDVVVERGGLARVVWLTAVVAG